MVEEYKITNRKSIYFGCTCTLLEGDTYYNVRFTSLSEPVKRKWPSIKIGEKTYLGSKSRNSLEILNSIDNYEVW